MIAAIVTAVLAILVFVVTQSFLKFVLEPIQEQRKLIGQVAHALLFYANVSSAESIKFGDQVMTVGADSEEIEETRKSLRGLAGQLRASLWTVPFYDALARLGWVPKREDVLEAATQLVGWSNSLRGNRDEDRDKRQRVIADRLGISKRVEVP